MTQNRIITCTKCGQLGIEGGGSCEIWGEFCAQNPKRHAVPPIQRIDEAQSSCKTHAPDLINHPPHYTAHPSGIECITITEHMGFNLGNAVKYIWRSSTKGATLDDLKKARWYVEREISRLERADADKR